MKTSSTITIRENNDLTNALPVLRQPTHIHTHASTHARITWGAMIRARMGSHLQRNLFNFQTFNLVLIFIHAHKPHPFSNRFTCFFSLYSTLIYYVVKKETLEKKSVKWIFGIDVCFFSLIFSPEQNQMLHLVTNVPRYVCWWMKRWKMTKSRVNLTIKNNAKVTQ